MNLFLIVIGKLALLISKSLNLGAGSTWPGHIAMEANPKFLKQVLNDNPNLKIVLVAGTNGKTTTSKLLRQILEEKGLRVFQNETGANLLNGMASTVIKAVTIFGKINYDVAIFEVDENNLRLSLKEFRPYAILLLNIFRDQLDRYGEVNKVANDWLEALEKLPKDTLLITNGDDPELTYIAQKSGLTTSFFGLEENIMRLKKLGHDKDFNYCPKCGTELNYKRISFSHMGIFSCVKCGFKRENVTHVKNLLYPLFGQYNIYNSNAAAIAAKYAFGIKEETINDALSKFKPAFGRQEKIRYRGKEVIILLSKNPAGANQSIDSINGQVKRSNILLLLNDRIPDGRDVSWIWDVDFEKMRFNKLFIGGDRSYDMALRIKYMDKPTGEIKVYTNLRKAIDNAVTTTSKIETLYIIPTYSAMLEARGILTGKKIL